jgi:hypothetical protein
MTMTERLSALQMKEWENWKMLVDHLKARGSVTEADCKSALSGRGTPGQILFAAIRSWGESLAELRQEIGFPLPAIDRLPLTGDAGRILEGKE